MTLQNYELVQNYELEELDPKEKKRVEEEIKKPSFREIYEGLTEHKKDLFDWIRSGCGVINIVTDGSKKQLADIKDTILSLNTGRSGREERAYGYMQWDEDRGFQVIYKGEFVYASEIRNGESDRVKIGETDFFKASKAFTDAIPASKYHDVDVQVVVLPSPDKAFEDPSAVRIIKDIVMNNDEDWTVVRKCIIIVDKQHGDNAEKRRVLSIQKIPVEFRNYSETIMWKHAN